MGRPVLCQREGLLWCGKWDVVFGRWRVQYGLCNCCLGGGRVSTLVAQRLNPEKSACVPTMQC